MDQRNRIELKAGQDPDRVRVPLGRLIESILLNGGEQLECSEGRQGDVEGRIGRLDTRVQVTRQRDTLEGRTLLELEVIRVQKR